MASRTAILLGASGLVGGHLLDILLQDPSYSDVTILVRRELPARHAKLRQVVMDFEKMDGYADRLRGDDMFCALGTTIAKAGSQDAFRRVDHDYPLAAATLASSNGMRQFLLVSGLGASRTSRVFYSRVKGEIEEAVSALPFNGVQIFQPSLLLGERPEFRLGERIGALFMRAAAPLMLGPIRKYRPIHARTVAAAMVSVAKLDTPGVHRYESDRIASLGAAYIHHP